MRTQGICGAWMPRAKQRCARGAGHGNEHRTPASVEADLDSARRRYATPEGREGKRQRNATPEAREARRRRAATPEYREAKRRRSLLRYGITPEDMAAILEAQGDACAICQRITPNGYGWHVDHYDDADGRPVVRGILCSSCNLSIGQLGHSPAVICRALGYLLAHQPKKEG